MSVFPNGRSRLWLMHPMLACLAIATAALGSITPTARALPPPDEIPEEVLRARPIFDGRSPVDGQPLSAAEYERLQAELAESEYEQQVDPQLQEIVFLLRVLRAVRILTPL